MKIKDLAAYPTVISAVLALLLAAGCAATNDMQPAARQIEPLKKPQRFGMVIGAFSPLKFG